MLKKAMKCAMAVLNVKEDHTMCHESSISLMIIQSTMII